METSEHTKTFVSVVLLMLLGTIGRLLMQEKPINWRQFFGEALLSVVIAATLFAFGAMQNMLMWQVVFVGGLAGIGGVKSVEWIIQIVKAVKKVS